MLARRSYRLNLQAVLRARLGQRQRLLDGKARFTTRDKSEAGTVAFRSRTRSELPKAHVHGQTAEDG